MMLIIAGKKKCYLSIILFSFFILYLNRDVFASDERKTYQIITSSGHRTGFIARETAGTAFPRVHSQAQINTPSWTPAPIDAGNYNNTYSSGQAWQDISQNLGAMSDSIYQMSVQRQQALEEERIMQERIAEEKRLLRQEEERRRRQLKERVKNRQFKRLQLSNAQEKRDFMKDEVFKNEFVKVLNTFYLGIDEFFIGKNLTILPHEKSFYPEKYYVSANLYNAMNLWDTVYESLSKMATENEEFEGYIEFYYKKTEKMLRNLEELIIELETVVPPNYPNWRRVDEIINNIMYSFFSPELFEENKHIFKSLQDDSNTDLYENLKYFFGKMQDDIKKQKTPKLGIFPAFSSDKPLVVDVVSGSIAQKSGLHVFDVIDAVVINGEKYYCQTLKDLVENIAAVQNDRFNLMVNRDNKRAFVEINLQR